MKQNQEPNPEESLLLLSNLNMKKNKWEEKGDKLQLSLYLMPILGPILVLISFGKIDGSHTKTAILSLRLGLSWIIAYSTLWLGSNLTSDIFSLRLLYLNGIFTTGYFLACLFFIIRVWNQNSSQKVSKASKYK